MYQDQNKLVAALTAENLLTKETAAELLSQAQAAKKTPEELIISRDLIAEDKLTGVKAKLLDLPAADLKGKEISKKVLNLIPAEVAENYQMIPFNQVGSEIHLGLVNPQNFKAIEAVEFLAQKADLKVRYFIISPAFFGNAG